MLKARNFRAGHWLYSANCYEQSNCVELIPKGRGLSSQIAVTAFESRRARKKAVGHP